MKYNLILENWKQFLSEQDMASVAPTTTQSLSTGTEEETEENKQKQTVNKIKAELPKVQKAVGDLAALVSSLQEAKKKKRAKVVKKKSGDRCTRIAKRKYDVWPSAYASGAVVKCRQGKIWKGVSENASDQEIDDALLLEEIEVLEEQNNQLNERCWKGYTQKGMKTMFGKRYPNCVKVTKESVDVEETNTLEEKWSGKYKRSIDCKNPKGFSQKAHCQGKKKNEDIDLGEVEIIEEAKKKDYKPNFSKEKEQGLHGWFARNDGKGWVNCRTGGPCGRDSADKGGKYPACRPTKAQCKSAGKGPLRKKKSSSPISWTKKKKKD